MQAPPFSRFAFGRAPASGRRSPRERGLILALRDEACVLRSGASIRAMRFMKVQSAKHTPESIAKEQSPFRGTRRLAEGARPNAKREKGGVCKTHCSHRSSLKRGPPETEGREGGRLQNSLLLSALQGAKHKPRFDLADKPRGPRVGAPGEVGVNLSLLLELLS